MTNEERQQAIEWLKRRPVMMAGAKRMYDLAVEALEAYVPDMNVGRWIPVSERLPQSDPEDLEYPTVIICLPDGSVELGCFYESTKEWGAGENFDRLRNPVAWMPLPEPWKGEGNGQE